MAVIDATGIIAFNDDAPGFDSFLQVELPADGDYLVAVSAFGSLPSNPFDSGSGSGATTEGPYELTLSYEFAEDVDVYRVDMRSGDVLGVAVTGEAETIEVFDPAGRLVMGSGRTSAPSIPTPARCASAATRRPTTWRPSTDRISCASREGRASTSSTCACAGRDSSRPARVSGRSSSSTSTVPSSTRPRSGPTVASSRRWPTSWPAGALARNTRMP